MSMDPEMDGEAMAEEAPAESEAGSDVAEMAEALVCGALRLAAAGMPEAPAKVSVSVDMSTGASVVTADDVVQEFDGESVSDSAADVYAEEDSSAEAE